MHRRLRWPLRKSHQRSLLTSFRGPQEVEWECFCDARNSEREKRKEIQHTRKSNPGLPSCSFHCVFFFFFSFSSMFPNIDASIVPFNLISVNKCRRRGQRDSPLCQMRSVNISHQTRADQRPACAHAGWRIKPHHAQPPQKKKKSLSTRVKRLRQEWNLIQGELLKWVSASCSAPDQICVCDTSASFVACPAH